MFKKQIFIVSISLIFIASISFIYQDLYKIFIFTNKSIVIDLFFIKWSFILFLIFINIYLLRKTTIDSKKLNLKDTKTNLYDKKEEPLKKNKVVPTNDLVLENHTPETVYKNKKIIGIGGGGCNIVDYLTKNYLDTYDGLIINSDKKALFEKEIAKIYLEKEDGLGCGSNEFCGFKIINKKAIDELVKFIDTSKEIYIIATLGGGVGSGSTKAIVQYLSALNIKMYIVLVKPFSWEGNKKENRSTSTIDFIKSFSNDLYILENDSLLEHSTLNIKDCFNIENKRIHSLIQNRNK